MNIPANQVAYRRRVGSVGSRAVFGIGTTGGLHIVVAARGAGFETLGAGSHPGIARHIAKKHAPEIVFDDLAKSELPDIRHFADLLPDYEELTAELRRLHND